MNSQYGQVGTLQTAPENREDLVAILTKAADLMNDLDDCFLYYVSKDADDDTKVWVMELWATKEAHNQSLTKPEVRELISQAMPMIMSAPSGANLIPVGGKFSS